MAPEQVLQAIDIVGSGLCGLGRGIEDGLPDESGFDGLEERLDHGPFDMLRRALSRRFCRPRSPFSRISRAVRWRSRHPTTRLSCVDCRSAAVPLNSANAPVITMSSSWCRLGSPVCLQRLIGCLRHTVPAAVDPAHQRRQPDTQILRYLASRTSAGRHQPYRFIFEFLREPLLRRHRVRLSPQENSPLFPIKFIHQLRGTAGERQADRACLVLPHNLGLEGSCIVTLCGK